MRALRWAQVRGCSLIVLLPLLTNCGSDGPAAPPGATGLAIAPEQVVLVPFQPQDYSLTAAGVTPGDVVWTVQEAPFGGTVDQQGHYRAPGWLGTFHVIAALASDPAVADTAEVKVAQGEYLCANLGQVGYEHVLGFQGEGIYDAPLHLPSDVEWYGGFVWVSDTSHQVLRKYAEDGEYIGATGRWAHCWQDSYGAVHWEDRIGWLGRAAGEAEAGCGGGIADGRSSQAPGGFRDPCGLAFDPGGRLFAVDSLNDRIQIFDSDGTVIGGWGQTGSAPGTLKDPIAIDVTPSFVYTSSPSPERGVQVFTHDGALIEHLALSFPEQIRRVHGLAVDRMANIYLVDSDADRLTVLSPTGAILFTWGDVGANEYTDDCMLLNPRDVEIDGDGNIYVIDAKSVAVLAPTGDLLGRVATGGQGLALDPARNLYVLPAVGAQGVQRWRPVPR